MGEEEAGPCKGVPPGPLFLCFISSRDKPVIGLTLFSLFETFSSRMKRHHAKELPRSFLLPSSGAFLGWGHLRARRRTL